MPVSGTALVGLSFRSVRGSDPRPCHCLRLTVSPGYPLLGTRGAPCSPPATPRRDLSQGKLDQDCSSSEGVIPGSHTPPPSQGCSFRTAGPGQLSPGPLLKEDGLVSPPGDPQSLYPHHRSSHTLGQHCPSCPQDCELWEEGDHIRFSHTWSPGPGALGNSSVNQLATRYSCISKALCKLIHCLTHRPACRAPFFHGPQCGGGGGGV